MSDDVARDLASILTPQQLDELAAATKGRITHQSLEEFSRGPQVPLPAPGTWDYEVMASQEARAAQRRAESLEREARYRQAREDFEAAESRRQAEAAPRVAALEAEIEQVRAEARPLEERLAPISGRLVAARREITELTTRREWDGTVPPVENTTDERPPARRGLLGRRK